MIEVMYPPLVISIFASLLTNPLPHKCSCTTHAFFSDDKVPLKDGYITKLYIGVSSQVVIDYVLAGCYRLR